MTRKVILIGVLLLGYSMAEVCSVSASQKELEGTGVIQFGTLPSEKKAPPVRTAEQEQRLAAFGDEIFEPKVPGLDRVFAKVKSHDLFGRFGVPTVKKVSFFNHKDPAPGAPTQIQVLTWQFPGMVIEVWAYPPSRGQVPDSVVIRRVEIYSPKYTLRGGLRIGESRSMFVNVLGEPTYNRKDRMGYGSTQIWLDPNDKVEKILWE